MSQRPPNVNVPIVNSFEDYQHNLALIEKAKSVLETYSAMNEEARSKLEYEQDLARKIAEGEKARQELEQLRSMNALALTAPAPALALAPAPVPQPTYPVANPIYTQPAARIEDLPTYSGHSEQQNVQLLAARRQNQLDQWRTQTPASYQHSFFTSSGVPREQHRTVATSTSHHYRPELVQQTQNQAHQVIHQSPMQAPPIQFIQPTKPIQPSQAGSVPAHNRGIYQTQAPSRVLQQNQPQQRQPQEAHTTNVHQRAPAFQAASQQTPRQDHWQQTTIPRSNEHTYKGLSSYPQATPNTVGSSLPVLASSSSLSGALESVSTAKPDTLQRNPANNDTASATATYPQPRLYQPAFDDYLRQYFVNNDFRWYLGASYSNWVKEMPLNSYYPIPKTPYIVYKRGDHSIFLVYTQGTGGPTSYDIRLFLNQSGTPLVAQPQSKPDPALATTQSPALPTTVTLQSGVAPAQQVATVAPIKPPQPISTIQPTLPPHSQQAIRIGTPADQRQALTPSSRRTPADADRKRLARDIIRALGIKRPNPTNLPGPQVVEHPAKRHEPEPVAQTLPSLETSPSVQPGQPIKPPPAAIDRPTVSPSIPLTNGGAPAAQLPSVPSVANILEVPAERDPQRSDENVTSDVAGAAPAVNVPTPMDVDEVTMRNEPTEPNAVLPLAQDEPIVRGNADDTAIELNRMSIEEEQEQVLHAHIEEIEEGEIKGSNIEEHGSHETGMQGRVEEIEEGEIKGSNIEEHGSQEIRMQDEAEEGEIQPTQDLEKGGKGFEDEPHQPPSPTMIKETRPEIKIPLFLPSPSASPLRAESSRQSTPSSAYPPTGSRVPDEGASLTDSLDEGEPVQLQRLKSRRHQASRKNEFYVLIPPPPPYVRQYKEQEARRRKRRKFAQQTDENGRTQYNQLPGETGAPDPVTQLTIKHSTTRLAEKRCKWSGCDAVLNSSQNLFEHLRQIHCAVDYSKRYIVCYWSGCGNPVANAQIEEHLASHTFFPLPCAYKDCDESFRMVQSLMKHNDSKHEFDALKNTPEPFASTIQEPPPIPPEVPAFLIKSGLVRQKPISIERHHILGPWVFNNIAGPVKVTKRYNAAKSKPPEYGFLQTSAAQFSTNPSQPARLRELGNLSSVEVSEMASEGLVIWPPPKPPKILKTPDVVFPTGAEEDELMDETLVGSNNAVGSPIQLKEIHELDSAFMAQRSEEEAVETMLTGQL